MLINGSALDDSALNDEPQPFGVLKIAALSDALTALDVGRELATEVIATAALSITDQASLYVLKNRTTSESVALIELVPRTAYRDRIASDTVVVDDSASRVYQRSRQLSESVIAFEDILFSTSLNIKARLASDSISPVDFGVDKSFDVLATASLSLVENVISNVFRGGGLYTRISSDTCLITDGFTPVLLKKRLLSEALFVIENDRFDSSVEIYGINDDAVAVTDQMLASRIRRIVTSDGLTMLDLLNSSYIPGSGAINNATASDVLLIGDQAVVQRLRNRWLSETTVLVDSTPYSTIASAKVRTLSDALGLTDDQLRALRKTVVLLDSLSPTDDTVEMYRLQRILADSLTASDNALTRITLAFLYDVRIRIGSKAGPRLGARSPIVLGAR